MTAEYTIAEPLAEALAQKGYETLTPVQEAVLAPDLAERDLLVSAQTGSGKTVAFGLALAGTLLKGATRFDKADLPLALIITPTRELALQVTRELQWLYAPAGGRIISCIGGMDARDERRNLNRGAHIVVGTPGRLGDHIRRGSFNMSKLEVVVLDEADEMLDMGFREELEYILDAAPEQRRTLMFSATVSKPIARLAQNYQQNAERVNTVSSKTAHIDISYQAVTVTPNDSEKAIINLLLYHDAPNAIVFCARRETVNRLTSRLSNRGFSVVALSGEYSQKERTNSLMAMRSGRARVCVATDVAARGIDLPGLDLVIHADLPQNKEALLHRSGRTGRAGRKGVCALIVPVRARRRIERLLSSASVEADWGKPPSVADIEAALDQRLLEHEALTAPMENVSTCLLGALLEKFTPEQLAAGIIRLTRHKDTSPEDLQDPKDERPRRDRKERSPRGEGRDHRRDREDREPRRKRGGKDADFADGAWIKLGVGRKNNADPKWLVPMLCKAGGFSRDAIGVIQISPGATHVELKPEAVDQLMKAAGPEQVIDKSIWVDRSAKPDGEAEDGGARGRGRPRDRGSDRGGDRGSHRGRDRGTGRDKGRDRGWDRDGEGDRDRPARARSKPRTGDKTGAKPAARKRADFASGPGKAKKLKKPRTGPKKPRGPNGEKKRSPKKPPA